MAVHPQHLAFVLLSEDAAIPGVSEAQNGGSHSLFVSVIDKAGGDATLLKRAIQKQIVRLAAQDPAPTDVSMSAATLKVLREAQSLQKTMHDSYIAQDHILLALLKDPNVAAALKEANLNEATLKTAVQHVRGNRRVESKSAEQGFDALNKYAIDLTKLAEEGKLDPVIGRVSGLDSCFVQGIR